VERQAVQHTLTAPWGVGWLASGDALLLSPGLLPLQRIVPVQPVWPLLSSAGFWLLASLVVGLLANQLPNVWLLRGEPAAGSQVAEAPRAGAGLTRTRNPGPPAIRVWKRWIPDAGGALPGGVRKAALVRRDVEALRRLLIETRRAELVHWVLWPAGLLTALWLPPAGVLVNLVFATAFNLPCLLLQRYNRARLRDCLTRLGG
jgi:glycosyl-4,4'-diaponeurosporenoate acyltransferase